MRKVLIIFVWLMALGFSINVAAVQLCAVCKKEATFTCSVCEVTSYCSTKHQSKNKVRHKKICQHNADCVDKLRSNDRMIKGNSRYIQLQEISIKALNLCATPKDAYEYFLELQKPINLLEHNDAEDFLKSMKSQHKDANLAYLATMLIMTNSSPGLFLEVAHNMRIIYEQYLLLKEANFFSVEELLKWWRFNGKYAHVN